MAKRAKKTTDTSTEEKIKEAARVIFMRKGYSATRTRDIAEEAGINLALLNYYFRSKEKLFELVMMEKLQKFFGVIMPVAMDPQTSLKKKLDLLVNSYITMLIDNPDLPIFVLSEIRNNPERFASNIQVKRYSRNLLSLNNCSRNVGILNLFICWRRCSARQYFLF